MNEPLSLEEESFQADMVAGNAILSQMDTLNQLLSVELRLPSEQRTNTGPQQASGPAFDEHDYWMLARYCKHVRSLVMSNMQGTQITLYREWIGTAGLARIDCLRRRLKMYRIRYYSTISVYSGMGVGRSWNLVVQLMSAECWLLLLRWRLLAHWRRTMQLQEPRCDAYTESLTRDDVAHLCNVDRVIVYADKLKTAPVAGNVLTQYEFSLSMRALSCTWHDTLISPALEHYVNWLLAEFVHIVLLDNTNSTDSAESASAPSRLDGAVNVDWKAVADGKSAPRRVCTVEFIAHATVLFSYFERDLLAVRGIVRRIMPESIPINQLISTWSALFHSQSIETRVDFIKWMHPQLDALIRARSVNELRDSVTSMMLRPGEIERYARQNNGNIITEFISAAECTRSTQQITWWTQQSFSRMIEFFQTSDKNALQLKDRVRDLMLLRVFHKAMQTQYGLDWWAYVVVHEYDIINSYSSKLTCARNPLVLMCGGCFGLYIPYRNDHMPHRLHLFRHADEVLVAWLDAMYALQYDRVHGMRFRTYSEGEYNITEMYTEWTRHKRA
jgi:hypothetical protein